jgi:hypothetical protein
VKAVPFLLKQFVKKAFAFGALLEMNEIRKRQRSCVPRPTTEELFQRWIQSCDIALTVALCESERRVFEKRTGFRS